MAEVRPYSLKDLEDFFSRDAYQLIEYGIAGLEICKEGQPGQMARQGLRQRLEVEALGAFSVYDRGFFGKTRKLIRRDVSGD